MEKTTEQIINEQWEALPVEIRAALSNIPWKARVADIAKREGLGQDKSSKLEAETLLILYGFLPPEEYPQNIQSQLEIEEEQAERIVKMVSNEIVADIEKQLEMTEAISHNVASQVSIPESTPSINNHDAPSNPASEIEKVPEGSLLEVAPNMLPETLAGEVAHDSAPANSAAPSSVIAAEKPATMISTPPQPLPPTEQQPAETVTAPAEPEKKAGYPGGIDPYREPIE